MDSDTQTYCVEEIMLDAARWAFTRSNAHDMFGRVQPPVLGVAEVWSQVTPLDVRVVDSDHGNRFYIWRVVRPAVQNRVAYRAIKAIAKTNPIIEIPVCEELTISWPAAASWPAATTVRRVQSLKLDSIQTDHQKTRHCGDIPEGESTQRHSDSTETKG